MNGTFKKKNLTPSQEDFIRENYLNMSQKELSGKLDVSKHYIDEFKRNNNLSRPISSNGERAVNIGTEGIFNVMATNWIT